MRSTLLRLAESRSPLSRNLLGVLSSAYVTLKRRAPFVVYSDASGDWISRTVGATFVQANYNSRPYDYYRRQVEDLWCHAYRPKKGDVVVDLGAGVGDEAVIFADMVGPQGLVLAVEAHSATFAKLAKTVRLNGLRNVLPVQVAVDDKEGTVFMTDDENDLIRRVSGASGTEVPAQTLDQLLARHIPGRIPDLVKINIEGAETAALSGGQTALSQIKNWVVSCHDFLDDGRKPHYSTYNDVLRVMSDAGLTILPRRQTGQPWTDFYIYAKR